MTEPRLSPLFPPPQGTAPSAAMYKVPRRIHGQKGVYDVLLAHYNRLCSEKLAAITCEKRSKIFIYISCEAKTGQA